MKAHQMWKKNNLNFAWNLFHHFLNALQWHNQQVVLEILC